MMVLIPGTFRMEVMTHNGYDPYCRHGKRKGKK